ncbi:MAG: hypothetical protein AB2A00_35395 [Myxococcota bacterium]
MTRQRRRTGGWARGLLLGVVLGAVACTGSAADGGVASSDAGTPDAGPEPRAEGSWCLPTSPLCRIGLVCAQDSDTARDGGGRCRALCNLGSPACATNRECAPLPDRDAGVCVPPR